MANRPFATAILTTYGGTISGRQDALAFAIPNRNDGYNKPVIIPPNFKKLTYGQFLRHNTPPILFRLQISDLRSKKMKRYTVILCDNFRFADYHVFS
uniref:Uncharacterized protein n=1 Tax=Klebsiella pneumoniae TaxID=573 RepID=A0A8B0SS75_KLEPN|nr:hypothetical protein [Klebsiella pneumoniae]